MVLAPSAARTSSSNGGVITIPDQYYSGFVALLDVTAISTGTTLDVFIQRGLKNAAATDIEQAAATGTVVWDDFLRFKQVTTSTVQTLVRFASGQANAVGDKADATAGTSAGVVIGGPIGSLWRVKWALVGTSYTFSVVCQFLP